MAGRGRPLRRTLAQLVAAVVVVVIACAAVLAVTVVQLRQTQTRNQSRLLPATSDAQRLLDDFVNQETGERGYVITGDETFLQPYRRATDELPRTIAALRRHAAMDPQIERALNDVVATHDQWVAAATAPELAAARAGDLAEARRLVATGTGRDLFDQLRQRTGELQDHVSSAQQASNAHARGLIQWLAITLGVTLLLLAGLVAMLLPALRRLVIGPLERFSASARAASTDLSQQVDVEGPAEIVNAVHDVEHLRRQLLHQVETAREAVEALRQKGPAVLALRQALSSAPASHPSVAVATRQEPAEGMLAGDWVDVVAVEGHRLAVVIGDVAGHGPRPAVFALRLKHLVATALTLGCDPGDALRVAVRQLGDTAEMFATVLVVVIDPATQTLRYANAGHPAALLRSAVRRPVPQQVGARSAGVPLSRDEVRELTVTGPLLSSIVAEWSWTTKTLPFRTGDALLGFTDGVTEARDDAGRELGVDVLRRAVAAEPDPAALLRQVTDALARHTAGRRQDDVTMFACRLR